MGKMTIEEFEDFGVLIDMVEGDLDAKAAAVENGIRRSLAEAITAALDGRKMDMYQFSRESGISSAQVRRLLHQEMGGRLTLCTVVKAASFLGLRLEITLRDRSR